MTRAARLTLVLATVTSLLVGCAADGAPEVGGGDTESGTPTTTSASAPTGLAAEGGVPDGWTTATGPGFEVATPADWGSSGTGQGDLFLVRAGEGAQPAVTIEALPPAGVAAAERMELFTAPIAGAVDDFEVVGEADVTVPSADQGFLREITYVGAGPDGDDIEIHEYLVVLLADGVDVHVRAAAPADLFDDVQPVLRQIVDNLVVVPDTFPGDDPTT